jgi:hypothetical protein
MKGILLCLVSYLKEKNLRSDHVVALISNELYKV